MPNQHTTEGVVINMSLYIYIHKFVFFFSDYMDVLINIFDEAVSDYTPCYKVSLPLIIAVYLSP